MKKMSFVTFTEMLLQAGIVDQMRIDKMTKLRRPKMFVT